MNPSQKTGAKIQVANEMLPDSTEREVEVSGSINRVMDCIKKLTKIAVEVKFGLDFYLLFL